MHLIGVYFMGVYLTGVHLMGVYLTGVHFTGVYLTGVYLMGVHHKMQPFYLSHTYVFTAFDGRRPDVAFLFLALSSNLVLGPIAPGRSSYL
jgi:uncharacterized protein YjbI with pentapeptide repeats